MIKLYELRIGNFFQVEPPPFFRKKSKKIQEIKQKQVLLDGRWYRLEELFPIPITERVLLQCGFSKLGYITESSVFQYGDINCRLDENGLQVFGVDFNNLKPLKHLHELQNLYTDLTGKELIPEPEDLQEQRQEKIERGNIEYVVLPSNM